MPFVSEAQRRFAHTPTGMKQFGPDVVQEFETATKGKKLPERKGSAPRDDYRDMAQRLLDATRS